MAKEIVLRSWFTKIVYYLGYAFILLLALGFVKGLFDGLGI